MSQRAEKYARSMERRTGALEERADKLEESRSKINRKLGEYGRRLSMIEADMNHANALHENEENVRRRGEARAAQERRRQRREIERAMGRQRVGLLIAMALAVAALIVAVTTAGTERAETETIQPTETMAVKTEADLLATEPVETDPWEFVALYRAAGDPLEMERIEEALEGQGYFSIAVPLCWEYQDYMRTYCHLYGCPYPLALAVADWETRGQFNMDAIGPNNEVGIMQLNPGPDGAYHAELEAATGLDPTTPEGNIAGGCYLLGKYLEQYGDVTMAAMAYNMGQAGARKAWDAGITSTEYTDGVLEALERWECTVNAWAGE